MGKFIRFLILFLAGLLIILGIYGLVDSYQKNVDAMKEVDSWLEQQAIQSSNEINLYLNQLENNLEKYVEEYGKSYYIGSTNTLPNLKFNGYNFNNLCIQRKRIYKKKEFDCDSVDSQIYDSGIYPNFNQADELANWLVKYRSKSSRIMLKGELPKNFFEKRLTPISRENNYNKAIQFFKISDSFSRDNKVINTNKLEIAIPFATLASKNFDEIDWILGKQDVIKEAQQISLPNPLGIEKFSTKGDGESKLSYQTYSGYKYAVVALPYRRTLADYFCIVAGIQLPQSNTNTLSFISVSLLIIGCILLFSQLLRILPSSSQKHLISSNGIAKDVNWYEEKPTLQIPFLVQVSYLLTFKVEENDNAGNISKITPVEFILKQRRNLIENGEQVSVSGKMTKNNILSGRRLFNTNRSGRVRS